MWYFPYPHSHYPSSFTLVFNTAVNEVVHLGDIIKDALSSISSTQFNISDTSFLVLYFDVHISQDGFATCFNLFHKFSSFHI